MASTGYTVESLSVMARKHEITRVPTGKAAPETRNSVALIVTGMPKVNTTTQKTIFKEDRVGAPEGLLNFLGEEVKTKYLTMMKKENLLSGSAYNLAGKKWAMNSGIEHLVYVGGLNAHHDVPLPASKPAGHVARWIVGSAAE